MSNIQKTLDSLQPYVIGIRYLEGTPLVDVVFKEGWTVIEEASIKKIKGDAEMNYYMIFSEADNVGLDELLEYVKRTINLNKEREKKHELLREKVNELKEIFKNNSLTKLTRLKFIFNEEDLMPNINELDVDIEDLHDELKPVISEKVDFIEENVDNPTVISYLDEKGEPIKLTEEEKEMVEEEERAEINRQMMQNKKKSYDKSLTPKIELPAKRKIELAISNNDYDSDCDCGPNEACSKCMDSK